MQALNQSHSANATLKVQILKSHRNLFECITENGQIIEAIANGKIFKTNPPIPGDWAQIESIDNPVISLLQPRKNSIFRFQARERKKKYIAANVDLIALVFSLERPEYKTGILDRYLVRCAQWDIPSIVIFTKSDLMNDNNAQNIDFHNEILRVRTIVEDFYAISSINLKMPSPLPNAKSFTELQTKLTGKTILFMGQSGVGKTRLLSALAEEKLELKSNELSKSGKGSHTTTWAELIKLPRFNIMDSPGIRSFALTDLPSEHLIDYFPDLAILVNRCQYHNCAHKIDSKGCQLAMTCKENKSENKNVISRIESYWRILSELEI